MKKGTVTVTHLDSARATWRGYLKNSGKAPVTEYLYRRCINRKLRHPPGLYSRPQLRQ